MSKTKTQMNKLIATKDQKPQSPTTEGQSSFNLATLTKQDDSSSFPIMNAREIGWRSGQKELNLEVFRHWARGNTQ